MQLILRADVENLGRLGDTVAVKPGYGRNYLIPQGLAMLATPANLRRFENESKKLQAKRDALLASARTLAEQIAAVSVEIEMRVGEGDKLYGSVTSAMIADKLAAAGVEVDRKKIVLAEPIKALGHFEVEVKLMPELHATVQVTVMRQGGFEDIAPAEVAAPAEEQTPADGNTEEETA